LTLPLENDVNNDAVQRLREPVAWALIAAAGLQVVAGLIILFAASSFSVQALVEVSSGNVLTGVVLAGIVMIAVLLVARGDTPSPRARTVTIAGLVVLGVAELFGVIAWLGALGANGETIGVGSTDKAAIFLYGAAKLIVIGVAGYVTYTVFQALQPARPAPQHGAVPPGQEGYQAYGYPQQGQSYGGYPPPQAPEYGQGQQYQQPYGQDYQQAPHQQQQPYGQPHQDYGQQAQQGYAPQSPAEGEGDPGLWTRSYGSDQQQGPGYSQSGEENDQNWYRDDRHSQ
jgi:hypothetical protein